MTQSTRGLSATAELLVFLNEHTANSPSVLVLTNQNG